MLLLLISQALACGCPPRVTPQFPSGTMPASPMLLFSDYRSTLDPTHPFLLNNTVSQLPTLEEFGIHLSTPGGTGIALKAGPAYCTLNNDAVYAYTPSEPLAAGTSYTLTIDASGDTNALNFVVNDEPQTAPTDAPTLTRGRRGPTPWTFPTSCNENEFVWHTAELPTTYLEYQVADESGEIRIHTAGPRLHVGSSACGNSWLGLTDDTVLFARARYLNLSGQSGPWSAWTPTGNAPMGAILPASDATIDCGEGPTPPETQDRDAETDTEIEPDTATSSLLPKNGADTLSPQKANPPGP